MHSQYIGTECHNAKTDGGIHEVARPPALKVKGKRRGFIQHRYCSTSHTVLPANYTVPPSIS